MKSPITPILSALCLLFVASAAKAEQVIISEIMYNPAGTKPEYIEITNISHSARDIVTWRFDQGVTYEFPDFNSGAPGDAFMKPRERIIISSSDAATTRNAYGISSATRVFGPWTGSLANGGETVTLYDKNKVIVATVSYKNGGRWPKAADGTGHSLMVIHENSNIDDWHNWKASPTVKGTSGTFITYADTWEWNIPASDPGTGWRTTTGSWASGTSGSGPGLLGKEENTALPQPKIQTNVYQNPQAVYLFRKSFTYNGNPTGATFSIDQMVEDGVTYYLNGVALGSVRHTPGAWNNLSSGGPALPGNEVIAPEVNILSGPATSLVNGTNILAAEVHNIAVDSSDIVYGINFTINAQAPLASLRLSEVHFDGAGNVDWVEIQNTGASPQSVVGLFLSSKSSLSDKVALTGTINANSYLSFSIPNGGFQADGDGKVNLFLADSANNIISAADLTKFPGRDSLQAIYPAIPVSKPNWQLLKTQAEWFSSTASSQNAANTPVVSSGIVINEIMCDPISEQAASEYIELYNKSGSPVVLTGWKLRGGVDFDFPDGTTVTAGGYLVVGGNKAYLQSVYGSASVVGDWSGRLSNKGEYLRLTDQFDNLADEVDYKTGGDWPDTGVYKGSSMELIHPDMDNNRASAWKTSDESSKGQWQSFTTSGVWLNPDLISQSQGGSVPNHQFINKNSRLWSFHTTQDAHLKIRNITLQLNGSGGNLLQNVGVMSTNGTAAAGWLAQGTHALSTLTGGELNLISSGKGNSSRNDRNDTVQITAPSLATGSNYTVSFEARWVYGNPILYGFTKDTSIGGAFLLSVPNSLGTAGTQNSRYDSGIPPQVDSVVHSPAVPKPTDAVKVTARVYSANPLTNVRVFHRIGDNAERDTTGYSSTAMVDNGTGGDAVSGDGVYTATINSHQVDLRVVQFYVQADTASKNAVSPPGALDTRTAPSGNPAMWIVDNRTMPNDLRRQRFVFSAYHYELLKNNENDGNPDDDNIGINNIKYRYRYPVLNGQYHPVTYIANEQDVYYQCEARGGGSGWHRNSNTNEFHYSAYSRNVRRIKWKLPNDRLFRNNSKLYSDVDLIKNNGLDNMLSLYQAYLIGFPAANLNELGVHTVVNGQLHMICSETEMTDNDLVNRVFEDGSYTPLHKCTGLWNWTFSAGGNSYAAHKWYQTFPLATLQFQSDYSPLAELFKTIGGVSGKLTAAAGGGATTLSVSELPGVVSAGSELTIENKTYTVVSTNNPGGVPTQITLSSGLNAAVASGVRFQVTTATREQLDRVIDSDMFFLLAAARGYAGDWDSITYGGNNGYLYQRPSDLRWIALHWDGDSAYEGHTGSSNPVEAAAQMQMANFFNKPWNRRLFNFYLTEILNKYSKGSNRITTWIDLQYNSSPSLYAFVHTTALGPGSTAGFDHGGGYLAFDQQYVNFFVLKEQRTKDAINASHGIGGVGNALTATFAVSSPGNGSSTGNATVDFSGAAPSSAYCVAIDNHPEAVFAWTNQVNWTLSGVVLKTGSNNLAVRMLDKSGLQVGTTINWTVNKTGNAAPFMKLEAEPDNVKLGELLVLDASTSFDPDNSALTYSWVSNPAVGFTMTTPLNSQRNVVFSTPGIYAFTVTGNDGTTGSPITREVAVSNADDFEAFTTPTIDTSKWTIGGMEIKNNNYPSRWYSLYETPGQLLMAISDNSAKNLTHGNNQPTLLRNVPATGDMALLTELTLAARKSGNFFAGLYLETNEAEGSVKYAFGIENGNQLIAKRITSGGITNLGSTVTTSIENETKLRIRRVGNQLRFERKLNGVWDAPTLFTHTLTGAQTLSKGGVFHSTSAAENARVAFDYIMVVDPSNNPPPAGLRITELMYNPREGEDFEYIEVRNTSGSQIELNGTKFTSGITLNIATSILMAPGETAVFVKNTAAFQSKYPGVRVLAQWTDGKLSDDTDHMVMRDAENNIIHEFDYHDDGGWPTYPDGKGGALEVVSTSGNYSDPANWRSTEDRPGGGVDTDGDGIPDAWEVKFGTNSSDPLSKPRATTSVNGSNQTQISWGGVNGQNYRVQYCDNLGDAWQTVTGASSVPGVNGTVNFTDPQLPRPTKRFYRIMAL